MDTVLVVRIAGVVFLSLVFIATVLLMPRILGVNPPSAAAGERPDVRPPAPAALPSPAPTATPPPALLAPPSERLVKR